MATTMIALVGEQPLPNLMPVLYYKPERVLLVFTERTEKVTTRLQKLLPSTVMMEHIKAYDIADTETRLEHWIDANVTEGETVVFNLTGGTKLMALPAYRLAEKLRSPFIYLESGRRSVIYAYHFSSKGIPSVPEEIELPELIDIDTFLQAYVDNYTPGHYPTDAKGALFEKTLYHILETGMDEAIHGVKIGGALDIDVVVRIGNRVGIIEAKVGSAVKKGIDQLNTAGGQEYLGIYTKKFLVMGEEWDHTQTNLRELAAARNITVIELPSYDEQTGSLSSEDKQRLVDTIHQKL